MSSTSSSLLNGNLFHKRQPSLTTVFPPSDKRKHNIKFYNNQPKRRKVNNAWIKKKLFEMSFIQLVGVAYLLISFTASTFYLINSILLLDPGNTIRENTLKHKVNWDKVIFEQRENRLSSLNEISPESRLSKLFSKSIVGHEFVRPYWFTASIKPSKEALSLTTVVELKKFESLINLAELYKGPISATLLVPSREEMFHEDSLDILTKIRHEYETNLSLRRHVDIHLVFQHQEDDDNHVWGYQKARNIARLFSRTEYIALVPVDVLWFTSISSSFKAYTHLLRQGDLLILPMFGFPPYEGVKIDTWPTDKQTILEWVETGDLGLLDYNYELNNGPTSFSTWKDAKEPYLVPNYDYKYGPIYISSKSHHPWFDERFEDFLPSCVYTTYLAGANLWVLPNDYTIGTGQGPINSLETPQQRKIQNKLASKYRLEQCVFYARRFDQVGTFNTEKAAHVKQECSKALSSLQKEKMISNVIKEKYLE